MLIDPDTIEYPDFRDYIVGVVERFGLPPILCYDRDRVIAHLAEDMGDDAEEFFEYNTLGTYAGPSTPCFISYDSPVVAECGGATSRAAGTGTDSGTIPHVDADGNPE